MKCILLVRVSTEVQSYEEQEKELFDLAIKHGYSHNEITAVAYKESAIKLKEEERAGLNEMKNLIETGEYDCVFAWEISRIARRKKILFSILDYLIERKIQLIIKEPSIILLKQNGEINEGSETIFTLYAQIAESEMRNKMARFERAKKEGFNKGKYMGGKIKLGYRVNEEGYWDVDEEGAKLVRMIFDMYNSGEYSMTELGKELYSRGYFSNLSITNIKTTIHRLLKNPIYIGVRTSNNKFPAIIDQETWNKCEERRKANKHITKAKGQYLLLPLIRCICGASYSVNAFDGCYNCRIKHNAVEKGLKHTPDIHGSFIESLVWYVALQELHQEKTLKQEDVKSKHEEDIKVYHEKIDFSEKLINSTQERCSDLDEAYFAFGRLTKERYEELRRKQNETIAEEQNKIRKYKQCIKNLELQIEKATTFDEMFDSLSSSFDELKNGTDYETMKRIIHRYIKEIRISPVEGKLTSYWKRIYIKTANEDFNQKKIEELNGLGMEDVAITMKTDFIVDVFHHKAYWDEELKYEVPFVYMDRMPRLRKETRKNRVRKPTKNHQY